MTSTVVTPTASITVADVTPERGTRLRRRAAGATAIASGVITLAGFLTCPWETAPGQAVYLESLLRDPRMAMISMVLLHYGYLLFVPTAFVLARLARRRAPKLAATGLVLSVLGAGLSGLLVTDAYDLAIAQHLPMAQAVQVTDAVSPAGMAAIALPTAFGTIFGLVILLAAFWRARWISWLPGAVMLVGWVISFGAHDMVRACSGAALVVIALVAVGVRILRASDTEFAAGEPE
jgi:MFS family permease